VAWGYAYLAVGETGVVMLDVSNPTAPIMAGLYNTPGMTHDVATPGDGYVYAADGNNGLIILRSSFSITGWVTEAGGTPVSGVMITATGGKTAITGAAGAYVFNDMLPGTYTLTASKVGYNFGPAILEVTLPPNAIGKNFTGELLVTKVFLPVIVLNH
jgi:protocatechuate 3,4-dioxygenase beta subunit